jgi:flagellar basal body-associated protein FliL
VKKSTKIIIIASIAVAVIISALAVVVHLKQSAIEGTEHANETISQKVNEAVNAITKPNETNSEANESPEQRANEGK